MMAAASLQPFEDLIERDPRSAAEQLRERLARDPLEASAYRLLARALEAAEAREGVSGELRISTAEFQLTQAANALQAGKLDAAEAILARRLGTSPDDADALRMMAHVARLSKRDNDEEELLRLALEARPTFIAARFELSQALDRQKRHAESLALLDEIVGEGTTDLRVLYFRATELTRLGRFEEAAAQFGKLTQDFPDKAEFWTNQGHVLKILGKRDDAVAAFKQALDLAPTMGVVWWSLSELKTHRFSKSDVERMQAALNSAGISDSDRLHLHFALGKAFEDAGDPENAFTHYSEGNRLRRSELPRDNGELRAYVAAACETFDRRFFEDRDGAGNRARDPIFILGMTRAGSTLIEQILSSHPDIEGTMELPDMPQLAKRVSADMGNYADRLSAMTVGEFTELGSEYLRRTSVYRKTDRPFFLDKMPNNWMHLPLIHLTLPNARIIDARRHPMACCFSNFKQHFATGQAFSYDQRELGDYYSDYVRLMQHIDRVLPGRVYRVIHERLVDDTESEVRSLLDYLELPFDPACLRFYETKRAVRTASSDQVRQPINRASVDAWRAFDEWLGPLKEALGPVLDSYPDAPDFASS